VSAPLAPLDAAETGFFERLRAPAVVAVVGTDETEAVRAAPGQWTDTEDPTDYPRVAFQGQERPWGGQGRRGEVILTVDMFAWHEGEDPDAVLAAVDAVIYAACADQCWRAGGRRLKCIDLGARSWPTPAGRPLRRTRKYRVYVS
jgi:hypothetical protein